MSFVLKYLILRTETTLVINRPPLLHERPQPGLLGLVVVMLPQISHVALSSLMSIIILAPRERRPCTVSKAKQSDAVARVQREVDGECTRRRMLAVSGLAAGGLADLLAKCKFDARRQSRSGSGAKLRRREPR